MFDGLHHRHRIAVFLHALVLDGVYHTGEDGTAAFIEAAAPSQEQLQTLLHKIICRFLKLLTRLGHLIEEDGVIYSKPRQWCGDKARHHWGL